MGGWVYIVTNKPHGVLYTGVTAYLPERAVQHRDKSGSKFARKYNATRLVYAEPQRRFMKRLLAKRRPSPGRGCGSCG